MAGASLFAPAILCKTILWIYFLQWITFIGLYFIPFLFLFSGVYYKQLNIMTNFSCVSFLKELFCGSQDKSTPDTPLTNQDTPTTNQDTPPANPVTPPTNPENPVNPVTQNDQKLDPDKPTITQISFTRDFQLLDMFSPPNSIIVSGQNLNKIKYIYIFKCDFFNNLIKISQKFESSDFELKLINSNSSDKRLFINNFNSAYGEYSLYLITEELKQSTNQNNIINVENDQNTFARENFTRPY